MNCTCLFRALNRRRIKPLVPDAAYYWLLDRLTDNNGWRPLSYREARRCVTLTAWNSDEELAAAGYVIAESRYVDERHSIDWAVILWRCSTCELIRPAPGPGDPPHCAHGPMEPVIR